MLNFAPFFYYRLAVFLIANLNTSDGNKAASCYGSGATKMTRLATKLVPEFGFDFSIINIDRTGNFVD
jgi:hypothetical protein